MKSVPESSDSGPNAKIHSRWDELRKTAEAALKEGEGPGARWADADVAGLIHELDVHHVELEIQSEELRLKNAELKELFHKYADLYYGAPVGFVNLSPKWMIVEANNTAAELLGHPKEMLKRLSFSHFVHREDRPKYYDLLAGMSRTPNVKAKSELRFVGKARPDFFVHLEVVPFRGALGELKGCLIAFIDISRRKAAEDASREAAERLKEMTARLLSIQEEERKRIARDLHDSFGQTLAALKYGVETVLASAPNLPEDTSRLLRTLVPTVQMAIEEVRNLYTGLRPSLLDEMGIITTIDWLVRKTRAAFPDLHIESVTGIEENDVPEDLKIILFRIVQEALTNIEKHSGAEWVDLALLKREGAIELVIEDDGKGFDFESAVRKGRGLGLLSMVERADLSGGTLTVKSNKGRGTRVEARWRVGMVSGE